jgi:hypothetical protein
MDSSAAGASSGGKPAAGSRAMSVGLIVLTLIAVALGAYVYFSQSAAARPTPIGEVLANLRDWDERMVVVEGTVSAPINLGIKAYRLTDDTGSIMVVTERGLPGAGQTVKVEGFVKQVFQLAGIEQTIIYEGSDPDAEAGS